MKLTLGYLRKIQNLPFMKMIFPGFMWASPNWEQLPGHTHLGGKELSLSLNGLWSSQEILMLKDSGQIWRSWFIPSETSMYWISIGRNYKMKIFRQLAIRLCHLAGYKLELRIFPPYLHLSLFYFACSHFPLWGPEIYIKHMILLSIW